MFACASSASFRHAARSACVLGAVALTFVASPAIAALYKWTDANGRTVYSDTPPIEAKAEKMNAPAPAANPNAYKDMVNQDAEFKKRQAQRSDDASKAEKARADDARRHDTCTQIRGQLKGLSDPGIQIYRFNDTGDRIILDDEARKLERARYETMAREQKC